MPIEHGLLESVTWLSKANSTWKLLASVVAVSRAYSGGVIGSNRPESSNVGTSLSTG